MPANDAECCDDGNLGGLGSHCWFVLLWRYRREGRGAYALRPSLTCPYVDATDAVLNL